MAESARTPRDQRSDDDELARDTLIDCIVSFVNGDTAENIANEILSDTSGLAVSLAEQCSHESATGDEGPWEATGGIIVRWRCDGCGAITYDDENLAKLRAAAGVGGPPESGDDLSTRPRPWVKTDVMAAIQDHLRGVWGSPLPQDVYDTLTSCIAFIDDSDAMVQHIALLQDRYGRGAS